mmetsp:Transcript_107422/g.190239  ORF Transcript_107422/g.190239 Transcript_107422/m.190239 type:complete len:438 (+) Transcript_107422:39-1352(+)
MPSSSQVEVQSPPGLQGIGGCRGGPLITGQSGAPGASVGPIAPPQKPEGLKEELLREVTSAVKEHIEWKTAAAVDTLWQKGQRAMQHLQQQQLAQTSQLQSQLAACAEAHQQLQRENAMLRTGLEALMKHLTSVFGPPPQGMSPPSMPPPGMPPPGVPPSAAPPAPPPGIATSTASGSAPSPFFPASPPETPKMPQNVAHATSSASSQAVECPAPVTPSAATAGARSDPEDFHTPAGSPQPHADHAVEELPAPTLSLPPGLGAEASLCGGTGSDMSAALAHAMPAPGALSPPVSPLVPAFMLTLRRADNVPLGLDVRGDSGEKWLTVESVRPAGAVDAWNRQCAGDMREIRRGDRIININGSEDADSMREECLQKHLLRMTVQRGAGSEAPPDAPPLVATAASLRGGAGGGLRADANEFVPQAVPWPTYSASSVTSC